MTMKVAKRITLALKGKKPWRSIALATFIGGMLCSGLCAGPLLVSDDGPHTADAIVVIGGDHKPERLARAAALYQLRYSAIVVISAGTRVIEGGEYMPEAEVMRRQALALGVPGTALLIEDQSQSTYQNAYNTKLVGARNGFKSILLVTSTYQSRRAGYIFREVFGPDVAIWVQPAPSGLCTACWWLQPDQASVVGYEYYNWALLAFQSAIKY